MVHNGIEYGLMQAYAEGFEILRASEFELDLHADRRDLAATARSFAAGCSSSSYSAFEQEGSELEGIAGYVEDSGEGRWTIFEAIDESVPAPVHRALALRPLRRPARTSPSRAKVNAALRNQFGGHAVKAE